VRTISPVAVGMQVSENPAAVTVVLPLIVMLMDEVAAVRVQLLTATTADWPPELAAIWVVPTLLPVTTPADDTATMLVSLLDQNTVAPGTIWPLASCTTACSASCAPTATAGALGLIAICAGG